METITKTIIVPEKVIPEHPKNITKYIAFDGTEFEDSFRCKRYEQDLNMKKEKVIQSCIEGYGVTDFEEDNNIRLYYISSLEDIKKLENFGIIETYKPNVLTIQKYGDKAREYSFDIIRCDFELFGPGWYMIYWIDGGDYPSTCCIKSFKNYIETIEKSLKEYSNRMNLLIENKEKELKENGVILYEN